MKASVYIALSLDGYIARTDGGLDWLPGADGAELSGDEDFGYHQFMDTVDHLVMGRVSFEMVWSFGKWPYEKPATILSHSLKTLPPELPDSVELRNSSPVDLIEELKGRGRKKLYVDGGKTIQGFLSDGMIDELILTWVPVLIGEGIPLFGPTGRDLELKLLESRSYPNGFVQSRYEVL
ncbi:MAG: dihydrofolate reductase family protein [Deltaproteobacteria bacterium]|nr:dihydrofolate reductase family protein [Deltaproteobacteria bacterium]